MENSLLIMGLVILLFLSIYGYSQGIVALEKSKEKKMRQEADKLAELKETERANRRKAYDEKLLKMKLRSEEIRLELNRLEKVNLQRTTKDQEKVEIIKERLLEKQKAS